MLKRYTFFVRELLQMVHTCARLFVQPLDVAEDRDALSLGVHIVRQSQVTARDYKAHARLDRVFAQLNYPRYVQKCDCC